tara:strand:+ start:1290 stop:1445 length:156 start_codon:yes stop_codon:yes gene_type:complete
MQHATHGEMFTFGRLGNNEYGKNWADLDVWGDYSGWILAGHTHGGQVKSHF